MITIDLTDLFAPLSIAIISSYATYMIGLKSEQRKTDRLLYEKSFLPIFKYVEKDLHNKNLSLKETHELANQILIILSRSDGYYHPSVKDYALKIKRSNQDTYLGHWEYFSERFSLRYDKLCKKIGIPLRGAAYRLNQKQYKNIWEMVKLYFKLLWPSLLFILALLYIFYGLNNF